MSDFTFATNVNADARVYMKHKVLEDTPGTAAQLKLKRQMQHEHLYVGVDGSGGAIASVAALENQAGDRNAKQLQELSGFFPSATVQQVVVNVLISTQGVMEWQCAYWNALENMKLFKVGCEGCEHNWGTWVKDTDWNYPVPALNNSISYAAQTLQANINQNKQACAAMMALSDTSKSLDPSSSSASW